MQPPRQRSYPLPSSPEIAGAQPFVNIKNGVMQPAGALTPSRLVIHEEGESSAQHLLRVSTLPVAMKMTQVTLAAGQIIQIASHSKARRYFLVQNIGASVCYVQFGTPQAQTVGIQIEGGAGYEWQLFTPPPINSVFVYNPTTSATTVNVVEGTEDRNNS